jgi:2-haloacid dehalogenase
MKDERFPGIRACVFDVYGTLLDFNGAVERRRDRIGEKTDELSALWRRKQLEYSWLRSLMGHHIDFWQVTVDALEYSCEALGIADDDLEKDLMELYRELDCYPEVPATLDTLRDAGMAVAVLSNGAPEMLEEGLLKAGIRDYFDVLLSAEIVKIYKPHPSVYMTAVDAGGFEPGEILFLSANGWDIAGAAAFGFPTAWINRAGAPVDRLPFKPAAIVKTLANVPALLTLGKTDPVT